MGVSLGGLALSSPVLLAPMSGVTDSPFRRAVAEWGAGLVFSEMIASREMLRGTERSRLATVNGTSVAQPMAIQLAGFEPEIIAEAARMNEDRGALAIDLNFGCPAKKVVNKQCGAALMRDEKVAVRIMEAAVAAVKIPVTVKMRTGWDAEKRNAPRLARLAEACGVSMVTVHGRTRAQLYQGEADWGFIRRVKQSVTIPVVANGDITSVEGARRCLEVSGADGVMVGRGAYGRPWFPRQIAEFLRTGRTMPDPPLDRRLAATLAHFEGILLHHGIERGCRIARKHLAWYAAGLLGATAFRDAINRLTDPRTIRDYVCTYFAEAMERGTA